MITRKSRHPGDRVRVIRGRRSGVRGIRYAVSDSIAQPCYTVKLELADGGGICTQRQVRLQGRRTRSPWDAEG